MWRLIYGRALRLTKALAVPAFALCSLLNLDGCSRVFEGAGFENSGVASSKACQKFDARGREYWETCP
jgi:hypothetical protein